ncbi:hypothetical protein AUP68_09223 [Ilyonectria robusta]
MVNIRDGTGGEPSKKSWPRWRKFAIVGLLTITIPSCVGLGVGLGCKPHSHGGDSLTPGNKATSIWQPAVGDSWQIVLLKPIKVVDGIVAPDVKIYELDVYDNDADTIEALQKAGKKVICYFSAGSWENWRDDKGDFKKADLGKVLDGWPNERWIDVRSNNVRKIMRKRIKFAADKGCDAIDPDNVDGFQNDNGLDLTAEDAIDFVKFLSETASSYNMSTGLKNAVDIIADVLEHVHFSVNEQCVEYSECEAFAAFIKADKPVFHVEYPAGAPNKISTSVMADICSHSGNAAGTKSFSTAIKKTNLDGWVKYCGQKKAYSTELDTSD